MSGGQSIHLNVRKWQNNIGYVPQSIYLTDDTLSSNIALGVPEKDINTKALLKAAELAQLSDLIDTLPEGLETVVGERGVRLSGGQRQRIGIARALYHQPEILVLDEATSALDVNTELEVMRAIKALHGEKTIIIVAHRYSTVEHCDWIYKLENGVVVEEGTFAEVI